MDMASNISSMVVYKQYLMKPSNEDESHDSLGFEWISWDSVELYNQPLSAKSDKPNQQLPFADGLYNPLSYR